jgi:hypothetical protein
MGHDVTRQLWIDDSTHVIRKDVLDEGKSKREIVFNAAKLGEAARLDTFNYDPSVTKARNRTELKRNAPELLIVKAGS